jgi:hypothetical protein
MQNTITGTIITIGCMLITGCVSTPTQEGITRADYSKQQHISENRENSITNKSVETLQDSHVSEGDVTIVIQPEILSGNLVRVTGKTNLPKGTDLLFTVEGSGFIGQSHSSVVDNGRFEAGPFGPVGGLKKGLYVADVVMPIVRLQPKNVQEVVGINGENLTGPLVQRDALGVSVHASSKFTIGGTTQAQLENHSSEAEDCYNLGYRYGRYIALGHLVGIEGPPEDKDLTIPVECRDAESTLRGIKAAIEDVRKVYSLPLEE